MIKETLLTALQHCSGKSRMKLSIKQHTILGEGKNETNEKKRRRKKKKSEKKELDRGN